MEQLFSQLLSSLQGIWQHRWAGFGITWLFVMAGWAKVYSLPDEYQSTARVFVDTQSVLKPLMVGMTSMPNVEQQVAIMGRTLLSRPNIERVLRMVDLDVRTVSARDHDAMVEEMLKRIHINGTGTYDIYTISYTHSDRRQVRDVVQALLSIFLEGSFKGKRGDSEKAVQFIDEQIKSYEERLLTAENSVKEFRLKHNYLLPREGQDYGGKLLAASESLASAQLELAEAEQARKAIEAQFGGDEPLLAAVGTPAEVSELDARISALNKNLDALRLQYTDLHPDVVAALRLVAQLEEKRQQERQKQADPGDTARQYNPLFQQMKVALAESEARVAALRARVDAMQKRQAHLQEQRNAVPELESQLGQLTRDYQVNKENYEKFIARREAAKLSGELTTTTEMMSFKIIDPPTMPQRPIGPNRALYYSAVLAAGLLGGTAAALGLAELRPTFLSPAELRAATGMRVLGTIGMNWTDDEKRRHGRDRLGFGAGSACLLLSYCCVMAFTLLYQ
ncbi:MULTISPECIES: XrtA system polysaccharide chain length determinant [unclassified Duganella]|uniref:XrtA system polysaccharide chain length determinant n=1 Tax=unclassified Duganella TaxID=2636909 RepID=UPI0006FE56C8|nr:MULTISPECIES: XrtA system polysaccharide chain length determinant [unclassified Duganella]KQV61306.1 chain length-determining protein [Duganella sp. Root336D2]KRB92606.1 chain length-determining protein [Duganella sp. Root198D2]